MSAASAPDLVVAMLTYRRPQDLAVAVPAFLAELPTDGTAALLVVDNDPDASAAGFVAGHGDPRVRYVHEPEPGIAAGRNRALEETASARLLIFVDDDERPVAGWLGHLLATREATGASMVAGAVVSEYAHEPQGWLAAGRFFDRLRRPTGSAVPVAATNNLLLTVADLAGLRFDPAFGLTGGSDTLFTRTLTDRGLRLVWCDEAVVIDAVPAERLTREWVLRRARRLGNGNARVDVTLASGPRRLAVRARWLVRGAVRVAAGGARHLVGRATGNLTHDARGLRTLERGRGMIGGALGSVVSEYHREPSDHRSEHP